jgi:predicted nucleic-acid-binding protein
MIGLDTNVLVRFLVHDDEGQLKLAQALIKREFRAGRRIMISQLVLLEAEWVLRSRYEFSKEEIMAVISGLLESVEIELEGESAVEQALYLWRDSASEFADCLIGASYKTLGCRATAFFDAKALKRPDFISP